MQNYNQVKVISVPRIAGSALCPVSAISNLLALTPKGSNLPLFQYKQNSNLVPLTDTKVRRYFSFFKVGLAGVWLYSAYPPAFKCHFCFQQ